MALRLPGHNSSGSAGGPACAPQWIHGGTVLSWEQVTVFKFLPLSKDTPPRQEPAALLASLVSSELRYTGMAYPIPSHHTSERGPKCFSSDLR